MKPQTLFTKHNIETFFWKFCAFVSITMCLFDGNYHILLVKNEMANPKDFLSVASASLITYSIFTFVIGVISYMALGPGLLSPITENAAGSYDILGQKVWIIDS